MSDSGVSTEADPEARTREQSETEDIPLLPLHATWPAPSLAHNPRESNEETAVSGASGAGDAADEDLTGPSSIRIENDRATAAIEAKARALREAIDGLDVATVKWLLATGAPLTRLVDGTTPLHSCMHMREYSSGETVSSDFDRAQDKKMFEIIVAMVAAAKKSGVLDCLNGAGRTPLHLAIESGNLKTVQTVVNAGASISNLNSANESALHVAVRSEYPKILKYFLDNHDIPNSANKYGYAPIHFAAISGEVESVKLLVEKFGSDQLNWRSRDGSTAWHEIAGWNSINVAQYLLRTEYSWDLNVVDNNGNTPLYKAAHQGKVSLSTLLLRNGATLSVKDENDSAIKYISSEFNNPLTYFEDIFDECINEKKDYISVDYKVLSGSDTSQIKVLEDLVRFGQSKVLKHPTIESLIYFKWRCLLPAFYTIIVTYVTFMLSFNIFIITTFNNMDTWNATGNATPRAGACGRWHWTLVAFIYLSTAVLITQECIWVYLQKLHHFYHLETWLKLSVLGLALAVPAFLGSSTPAVTWQRHAACLALLLAWLQALLLLSRFPGWGYYVLMLERVAINILKILATSIFLVIGFSTCLMIQYQSKPPFDGPGAAFVKTLVMMLSEFDYEDLFGDDHAAELENTKIIVRILFVVFVIFIAIVLMNFVIAVAVSDVNELNDIGNIRRLEKQVELLSILEGLGDTVLTKWWRRLLLIRYHSGAGRSLSAPGRRWAVDDLYDPRKHNDNDYFRETFSAELHNAIVNVAKKKKRNVDKLDAVYDAVVGMPYPKYDNVSAESNSRATLNDRMKSIEDANRELKQSIDDFRNDRMKSVEDSNRELKQSIDDFKNDMNKILRIMASGMTQRTKANIVSSKVSRKRKIVRKKSDRCNKKTDTDKLIFNQMDSF